MIKKFKEQEVCENIKPWASGATQSCLYGSFNPETEVRYFTYSQSNFLPNRNYWNRPFKFAAHQIEL